MSYLETRLPRLLATILLLVSVAMFVTLIDVTLTLARGGVVPRCGCFRSSVSTISAVMMWLLTRKEVSLQLNLAAFALWLLTTG